MSRRHICARLLGTTIACCLTLATTTGVVHAQSQPRTGNCGARSLLGGGPQLDFVGLTADQHLVLFGECNPSRPRDLGAISGLAGNDTEIVGIDYRVQDGLLYGVGDAGGVYKFATRGSALATRVNQLTVALDPNATAFGVDFNPAADRLRIVSDTGQNLRHNVNATGTTVADGALAYLEGTPPAAVPSTGVVAAAYTNNDLDPTTATTLFDIDRDRDQVDVQSPPNNGVLFPTGKLGVDAVGPVGFDVYSTVRGGVTVRNAGFAAMNVEGSQGFYRVDLLTGAAVRIGKLAANVIDVAAPVEQ
jgi:hypothetical protein